MTGFEQLAETVTAHGFQFETDRLDDSIRTDIAQRLHLPESFSTLYSDHGPASANNSIPWVVEELTLPSFDELPAAQAGYRWHAIEGTESKIWPETWVVVASLSGDPFIIDVIDDPAPVLYARHGVGRWEACEIAPSMEAFLGHLTNFERILLDSFDLDVWDEQGLKPEFLEALRTDLTSQMSADHLAGFLSSVE